MTDSESDSDSDSDRRHIDCSKFGRSTKKVKASEAATLVETIQEYNLDNVKNIIISTGTNDSDTKEASAIYHDLIEAVHFLLRTFKGAVYLSQLPPRKFYRKETVLHLNKLIASTKVERCYVVEQNLTTDHLSDDKHIDEQYIQFFLKNIKDKMRETVGFTQSRKRYGQKKGREYYRHNSNENNNFNKSFSRTMPGYQNGHYYPRNSIGQFVYPTKGNNRVPTNNQDEYTRLIDGLKSLIGSQG